MDVEFRLTDPYDSTARALARAMEAEMDTLYGGLDLNDPSMPKATPEVFQPPEGGFLVGWDGEHAVACGGFKALPDGACEVKRMYVAPQARRQGVASQLLAALESYAAQAGYRVIRLDTGPRQPEAMQFYRSRGYRDIANFNQNPKATYFGEKVLDG